VKHKLFTFLVLLPTLALFALSAQAVAQDKKDPVKEKGAVRDVKFACSRHGAEHMLLTLSLEVATAPMRTIEFIGAGNGMKWTVQIDGMNVTTPDGATVKVHSGDTIKWSIDAPTGMGIRHGVAFAERGLADAMLNFNAGGQPLVVLNMPPFSTRPDWVAFGTMLWGSLPIDATAMKTVMVSATVK